MRTIVKKLFIAKFEIIYKTIIHWFKRNWFTILITIMLLYLCYKVYDYLKPITYKSSYYNVIEKDNSYSYEYRLDVVFTTSKAFLPYENIRVSAELFMYNDSIDQVINYGDAYLIFDNSYKNCKSFWLSEECDSDNLMSGYLGPGKKVQNEIGEIVVARQLLHVENCARIKFENNICNNTINDCPQYTGSTNVLYKKPGKNKLYIIFGTRTSFPQETDIEIEIGSTTDYLNMKNGNISIVMAILGILLTIKVEFLKDRGNPKKIK